MIPRKYLVLAAAVGLLVSLDQFTKFIVARRMRLGDTLAVIEGFFNITLVRNTGIAFSLFSNAKEGWQEWFLFLVPGLTLAALFFFFYRLRDNQPVSVYGLALIISGAFGNILDRIRLGYVVDFFDFHWGYKAHFPAFNVADAAIAVGVGLTCYTLFTEKEGDGP